MKKNYLLAFSFVILCLGTPSLSPATQLNPWQQNRDTGFDIPIIQPPHSLPLLTILLEFSDLPHRDNQDPNVRDQDPDVIESQIFGCDNNPGIRCMNGYWRESSYGQFEFDNVGYFDWVTAWDDPDTLEDESTVAYWNSLRDYGAGKFRWWALLSLYKATNFSFETFDFDGDNHIVLGPELAVQIIDSRDSTGGSSRHLSQNAYDEDSGEQVPNWPPEEDFSTFFKLGDTSFTGSVALTHGGAVDIGAPFYIFAHELGHSTFGFYDLYPAGRLPEPIWFTLYGGPNGPHHLDPFQRFKIGWLEPTVIEEDGWYAIDDVETSNDAYILHNPMLGTDEYFIVENRWAGSSYDNSDLTPPNVNSNIEDEGLILWHIDESREWNGNYSNGISKLQLIQRDGQSQNYSAIAFNAADIDCYDFNDLSIPANAQFWGGVNSNLGVWAVSEAGHTMEAYFDVPGPGILAYPKKLHKKAMINKKSGFSFEIINTDDLEAAGCGVSVSLQGLDEKLFDYQLPERSYLIDPKEPLNYVFSVTPKTTCDFDESSYDFILLVEAEGPHWSKSKEISATIELVPGVDLTVTPTEQVVRPNFTVHFNAQIANLGWEEKNIVLSLAPIPLTDDYSAYPDQIQPEWFPNAFSGFIIQVFDSQFIKPCGINSLTKYFSLNVPEESYAAFDDVVYEFDVVASHLDASARVRCQITVKATAQSMLNYLKRFGVMLLQPDSTTIPISVKAKALSIIEKMELAILKQKRGQLHVVEKILVSARNKTDAYINKVEAQTGKSLSLGDAVLLINQAQEFKMYIDTAIETLPLLLEVGDVVIRPN